MQAIIHENDLATINFAPAEKSFFLALIFQSSQSTSIL